MNPAHSSAPLASARLLAIVEVPKAEKVLCAEVGCGHGVWKAIHVVRDGEQLFVLGSTCFEKRYGSADALGAAHYGNGSARQLTPEERQLMVDNTATFIERMREEEELARAQAEARLKALRKLKAEQDRQLLAQRERLAPPTQRPGLGAVKPSPWPWMKPISSLGYFRQSDGSGWVRVQRRDGRQVQVPWPAQDGWDEALPARLGVVDLELGGYLLANVFEAVAYLEQRGVPCVVFGSWRDLVAATKR